MIFTKALVLKVLGGLAVCTGVTVGGVKLLERSGNEGKEEENKNDKQTKKPNEETQEVEQNQANQNNAQNLQQQPQTQQNLSGGTNEGTQRGGNPQSSQPQPQVANTRTSITISNSELLLKELGLVCTADTTNNKFGVCTGITEGKTITVEKGGIKREGITSLDLASETKIKYEKKNTEVDENTYNKLLKVTIFGGDITLNGGTPETITKLEQFETYEVKEEGSDQDKKYYLKRKTTIFDHKIKLLNIPKTCQLVTNETEESCSITKEQLEKINFDGRSSDPSVIGGTTASLTILKTDDDEFADQKYKFILRTDYTISFGSGSQNNKIISNTNTEFKIKETTPTGGGSKTLTLEKAWNLNTLAAKIGLTGCTTADSANNCTLPATINVSNGDNDKIKDATISGTNQKIKFLQDQPKHNQGFKFFPQTDIALSGGDPSVNDKKIESKGTYEIKKIGDKWYLSKVTTK